MRTNYGGMIDHDDYIKSINLCDGRNSETTVTVASYIGISEEKLRLRREQ